jgi:hypothetical protein
VTERVETQALFGEYDTKQGRITLHDSEIVKPLQKVQSNAPGNWDEGVFPIYGEYDTGQLVRLVIDLDTEEE